MESATGQRYFTQDTAAQIWAPAKWFAVAGLLDGVEGLYGDEEFADLTIICGCRTFKVHKAVVCTRSDFFRAACKKDTFREGRENVVTLNDDEPEHGEIIEIVIRFLYCLDYEVLPTLRECELSNYPRPWPYGPIAANDETLATHARVFAVAEKYGIPTLQRTAWDKAVQHLAAHSPPAHDLAEAIRTIYNFIADPTSKTYPWQTTLTGAMCGVDAKVMEDTELKAAVQSFDGLGFDLMVAQTARMKYLLSGT